MAEYAKTNPGMHFDRYDIERVGLFSNPSAFSPLPKGINKRIEKNKPENSRYRGSQFTTSNLKTKDGTCSGYFDKEYRRIFIKEAIPKPPTFKKKQGATLIMKPTNPTKKHSTPGDNYGCFSVFSHFRFTTLKKSIKKKKIKEPANCTIGPPGYFSPYPTAVDPRLSSKVLAERRKKKSKLIFSLSHKTADYFDPNPYLDENPRSTYILPKSKHVAVVTWIPVGNGKKIGGGKFGGFERYPEYFSPRLKPTKKYVPNKSGYAPQVWANKTFYTPSIIKKVLDIKCNTQTYRNYEPTYVAKYAPKIGE